MQIRLDTLGGLRILADGVPLDALSRQRLRCALLVYLSVEREAMRETVAALFWPDRDPERARHSLSQALYELRQDFGEEWLEAAGDRLSVGPDVEVDALGFQKAVEQDGHADALALYAGHFLEGVHLADTHAFEQWVEEWRGRLRRLHRRAARARIDELVASGDLTGALAAARHWGELDPLDDEAQHRLIAFLAESGARSEALRQYDSYAALLADDELEPLDETKALVARLRDGDVPAPYAGVAELVAGDRPAKRRPEQAVDEEREGGGGGGQSRPSRFRLIVELNRRRVLRVCAVYLISAWIALQVGEIVFPALGLPDWTLTFVIVLAILGFPIAVVLAWTFDLTPEGVVATGPTPFPRLARHAVVTGLVTLPVALGGLALWDRTAEPGEHTASADAGLDPRRIAVLYLDDHSPNRENQHIADGLTEALIHELAQVPALDVIPRNGVKAYRNVNVPFDSIVKDLRVGSLVEGSIEKVGDRLQVIVQLIDPGRAVHLESVRLTYDWGDWLPLQEKLAMEVSHILRERLGQEIERQRRRAGTESGEAWELVQRAERDRKDADQLALSSDHNAAQRLLLHADSLLATAARLDDKWVEPLVLRGWVAVDAAELLLDRNTGVDGPARNGIAETYHRGLRHVERALELEPADAGALDLRGSILYRLWDLGLETEHQSAAELAIRAERDLRAAVAANPAHAHALGTLSRLLWRNGEFAEAKIMAERAYEADAFVREAPELLIRLAQTSTDLEEAPEAWKWCEEGRRRFPNDRRFPGCSLAVLAWFETIPADIEQAWALVETAVRLSPPDLRPRNRVALEVHAAAVIARASLPDSARAVLDRAVAAAPDGMREALAYYEASVRAQLGQTEQALELLREYLKSHPQRRTYARKDWAFRPLWTDPRFQQLLGPTD